MNPGALRNESREIKHIVFGAGGHAKVVIETARAAGIRTSLVIDDNPAGTELMGIPTLKNLPEELRKLIPFEFTVAIGNNAVRQRLFQSLRDMGGIPKTVCHPFSSISPTASIGAGSVIFAGAVVNAETRIGENCILNTGCRVDHDGRIGNHVHLCPGSVLAGTVTIGERTMVGVGACFIPGINIGEDCVIGAGAVVIRNIVAGSVAFGNPAKVRKPFN